MNKVIPAFFALFMFTSCIPEPGASKGSINVPSVKDSLTIEIEQLNNNFFNGLSVAIVDSAGILYEAGIGYADVASNKPYTVNTIQPIASVSKTFIGVALMKAQEKGLLDLDDPISKFLSFEVVNPNHPEAPITIRQLATHTSSIVDTENYMDRSYILKDEIDNTLPRDENIPQSFNPRDSKVSLEEFLMNYLQVTGKWYGENAFTENRPGELFEYTNVGASLAAYIIEVVSGQSYAEFTTEHILQPLGMDNSGWEYSDIDFENVSTIYSTPETTVPHYSLITYPDGGFLTSIHDLSKYMNELIRGYTGNGVLLSPTSYAELFKAQLERTNFTEHDTNNPYNDEYNIGIFMGMSAKGNLGHTGGDPGVSSIMFFNAEDKIGRIFLMNTNINSQDGVDAYYGVFEKLGEFAPRLK